MKMDFDVAIFDMDGTLIDSMTFWRLSAIEYLVARGIPVNSDDMANIFARRCKDIIGTAYARVGGNVEDLPPLMPDLMKYMERHYANDVILKKGAEEYLDKLKAEGKTLVLATATPLECGRIGLEHTGIAEKFDLITDTNEVGVGKGDPEFYYRLTNKLGVAPERCVMFEDALYSIRSAKTAGLMAVGVVEPTDVRNEDQIREMSDLLIKDFTELL